MKKAILTFGLFSLMMVLTSFTSPENVTANLNTNSPIELVGGASTGGNRKVDLVGGASTGGNRKVDLVGGASTGGNRKVD